MNAIWSKLIARAKEDRARAKESFPEAAPQTLADAAIRAWRNSDSSDSNAEEEWAVRVAFRGALLMLAMNLVLGAFFLSPMLGSGFDPLFHNPHIDLLFVP